jgi:phosphopantothenoylcysteine decarboxylase/phosphopantothenate--cysteine ligase
MGIAIADAAAEYGADVELVLGPVGVRPQSTSVRVINVITAELMAEECINRFPDCDIAILSAAVSDFSPEVFQEKKIKKDGKSMILRLKQNKDIALALGKVKKPSQILVGFALETDNEVQNAMDKLAGKNLDVIVLNSLNENGAGFGFDTNRITIIDKYNNIDKFELKSKDDAAKDILNKIVSMIR